MRYLMRSIWSLLIVQDMFLTVRSTAGHSSSIKLVIMLCYFMLCYIMLCYVMLGHVMLCYIILCYIMSCLVIISHCALPYITSHYITSVHYTTIWTQYNITKYLIIPLFTVPTAIKGKITQAVKGAEWWLPVNGSYWKEPEGTLPHLSLWCFKCSTVYSLYLLFILN